MGLITFDLRQEPGAGKPGSHPRPYRGRLRMRIDRVPAACNRAILAVARIAR